MYRGASVGLVVPVHNAASVVGPVLDSVPTFVDKIFVVDDGSTDDTWNAITEYVTEPSLEAAPLGQTALVEKSIVADDTGLRATGRTSLLADRIVPVRHQSFSGVGAAVKTGYRMALINDLSIVAVVAGDRPIDQERLVRLVDPLVDGVADYVKGSRLASPGRSRSASPWRLFKMTVLSGVSAIISGQWGISDPGNSSTAITGHALNQLSLAHFSDDGLFFIDLLVAADVHEFDVLDVPVEPDAEGSNSGAHLSVRKHAGPMARALSRRLWTVYARPLVGALKRS